MNLSIDLFTIAALPMLTSVSCLWFLGVGRKKSIKNARKSKQLLIISQIKRISCDFEEQCSVCCLMNYIRPPRRL